MKKDKRKLILPLLLLLLLIGLGGTVAWLTSEDEIVNEFTVGEITSPTTDPEDSSQTITVVGNLYEKEWNPELTHKLVPGISYAKEPYVGIGQGSEESVVYVYVDNDFSDKVYFTINSGWTPVTNHVTAATSSAPQNSYTKGLFKYNTNLVATNGDAWTTALFNEVVVDEDADTSDLTPTGSTYNVTVRSLVHQAKDASGNNIAAATIEQAAIDALE